MYWYVQIIKSIIVAGKQKRVQESSRRRVVKEMPPNDHSSILGVCQLMKAGGGGDAEMGV
jgi:hypothetical protein